MDIEDDNTIQTGEAGDVETPQGSGDEQDRTPDADVSGLKAKNKELLRKLKASNSRLGSLESELEELRSNLEGAAPKGEADKLQKELKRLENENKKLKEAETKRTRDRNETGLVEAISKKTRVANTKRIQGLLRLHADAEGLDLNGDLDLEDPDFLSEVIDGLSLLDPDTFSTTVRRASPAAGPNRSSKPPEEFANDSLARAKALAAAKRKELGLDP